MQTYLNDPEVQTVLKAAESSHNYALIHKDTRLTPFGVKNLPTTFQQLINVITNVSSSVATYTDDVVMYNS